MISLRARFIRWITGWLIRRINIANAPIPKMRKHLDLMGRLAWPTRHVSVEKATLAGMYAEWYRPREATEGKVLLYLHGGAYALGSCDSHRKLVTRIAKACRLNAVMPEYRLAPEHPFPAGLDDCVRAIRSLLEQGYAAEDILVAGDSAGGGLAVASTLQLRREGLPLPGGVILLSPFLDMTASGESAKTRADRDPWFRPADVHVIIGHYCPGEDIRDPLLSPVFANVAAFPPTLIQVGDDEILLSDSTRFADKLIAAGRRVHLEVFPNLWHVFQLFVGKMPESRAAIEKIGEHVRSGFPDK
ncbi:MAG: alpha/beta hydrolase [Gammaproteobacteria bacterium]|nr:alpha/beta hydrolase [Gammaproteobacteria bacterium]MBT8105485.1 alpha/beta hydrolase [Gammaproteobacteria bacterium]NNF48295.1 alpha/beta hydrolase [Woeseiaceae bacterium]NNK25499.1 alpha/beta hydrolase [Woeseiaceae bacterium]